MDMDVRLFHDIMTLFRASSTLPRALAWPRFYSANDRRKMGSP